MLGKRVCIKPTNFRHIGIFSKETGSVRALLVASASVRWMQTVAWLRATVRWLFVRLSWLAPRPTSSPRKNQVRKRLRHAHDYLSTESARGVIYERAGPDTAHRLSQLPYCAVSCRVCYPMTRDNLESPKQKLRGRVIHVYAEIRRTNLWYT